MNARSLTLAEVGPQPVCWLWPNRIPYGALTLLVGHPGPGKSTLTCDIIGRITAGKPMYNCNGRPSPQGALLLAAEDDLAATIKPRLLAAGAATRRVRVLDCTLGEALRLPGDLPEFERELGDSQAKLLVIDPLMEFAEGSANSNTAMRKALSPLAKLARRTGTAVLLVDHLNKSRGGPPLHRVAGSVGIAGLVRSILLAAQLPGGVSTSPSWLTSKPTSGRWRRASPSAK